MKFKFKSEFILATSEIGSGYIKKVEISIREPLKIGIWCETGDYE